MSSIIDKIEERITEDAIKKIDYKMVTFSLAGKEYGIDIMKIKEISKVEKFTYVPNTQHFVRGVHNLRGEIISIIDLRKMFNLPEPERAKGVFEDVIILKLVDSRLGVVVDKINQVIGISRESIQPAPPIFSDINIKYINGVTEYNNNLYVILDVDRIFTDESDARKDKIADADKESEFDEEADENALEKEAESDFAFITETLKTFKHFFVTPMNQSWIADRLGEWKKIRASQGMDFQLKNAEEAEEFLKPFYSPFTGEMWDREYKESFLNLLPDAKMSSVNIWNPGCGKGFESFSLACLVRMKYPKARIKIWANDKDLLDVSNAARLLLSSQNAPQYLSENGFVRKSPNGYEFVSEIRDLVFFEYHDILSGNTIPEMDLIVARDVFSFFDEDDQSVILDECGEKLKESGLILIGKNEKISLEGFKTVESGPVRAYQKS